ncbi:hypothetical protein, partial [Moorena sp. SIO3B2]|uniref:hypothetical protein n=1 Tax=Moorena sp. SIO3B2 TaxID=2607827 RepID=UPI0025801FAA
VTHHCWVKQLLEDAPDFDSGKLGAMFLGLSATLRERNRFANASSPAQPVEFLIGVYFTATP